MTSEQQLEKVIQELQDLENRQGIPTTEEIRNWATNRGHGDEDRFDQWLRLEKANTIRDMADEWHKQTGDVRADVYRWMWEYARHMEEGEL